MIIGLEPVDFFQVCRGISDGPDSQKGAVIVLPVSDPKPVTELYCSKGLF